MVIQADPRYHRAYIKGDPEPWFESLLRDSLRHGDFFVDVGAHIGFFVLYAARLVGFEGRIVALEPDPENFAALKANIEINGLKRVEALRVAAWSSASPVYFKRSGMASGLLDGKVICEVARADEAVHEASDVDGVPLDDVVQGLPTLVKIDVEGAEDAVLEGMREGLTARRYRALLLELHPDLLRAKGVDPASCVARLREHGYHGWTIDPSSDAYRRAIDPGVAIDSLLLPLDRWRDTPWPHLLWLC